MEILAIIGLALASIHLHIRRIRELRRGRYLEDVDRSVRNLQRGGSITWS